jgi:hypothetical protein
MPSRSALAELRATPASMRGSSHLLQNHPFSPHPSRTTFTMFTRRAYTSVRGILPTQTTTAVRSRTFAVAAAVRSPARAPTLGDITPDSAASFNEKQKNFREGLIAAQKRKEQDESTSWPTSLSCTQPPGWLQIRVLEAANVSTQKMRAHANRRAPRRRVGRSLPSSTVHLKVVSLTRTSNAASRKY